MGFEPANHSDQKSSTLLPIFTFFLNTDPAIVLDKHNQYLAQIPHIKCPKTTLDDQLTIYILSILLLFSHKLSLRQI